MTFGIYKIYFYIIHELYHSKRLKRYEYSLFTINDKSIIFKIQQ